MHKSTLHTIKSFTQQLQQSMIKDNTMFGKADGTREASGAGQKRVPCLAYKCIFLIKGKNIKTHQLNR